MHKLIDYICEELDELERKAEKDGKLSMAEVQYMDTLAHTKKNLLKAEELMMDTEGSYYEGGSSRAGGGSGQSRARGRGRNAKRDSMGRYSSEGSSRYDGGGSSRYGSSRRGGQGGGSSYYGGSSYGDDMQEMVESIYEIMDTLPENVKQDAQKFVQKLEQTM